MRFSEQQGASNNPNKRKRDRERCTYKCWNCGGKHSGRCSELVKYFNYGTVKKGYKLPLKEQEQGKARNNLPQNDQGKGKTYMVYEEEDDNEEQVVRGTILIKNFKIQILIYTCCTYLFITTRIVKKLVLTTSTLPYPLRITAARDESEFTILWVRSLKKNRTRSHHLSFYFNHE